MSLLTKPKAILFDLDGTLAHTLPQLSIAASEVAKEMGIEPPSLESMSNYVGNGVAMLLGRVILGRHDITLNDIRPEQLTKARELFAKYYTQGLDKNFEVYPGVKEGIESFYNQGIKLAVVTNKPHVFAVPLLAHMGLDKYMGCILGGEVLDKRKPDPAPLLHVCEQLGVAPEQALMVGDSINDVKAGQNAHMPTVVFTYGYDGGYDVRTCCKADYLFDSFGELTELINSLPNNEQISVFCLPKLELPYKFIS